MCSEAESNSIRMEVEEYDVDVVTTERHYHIALLLDGREHQSLTELQVG